MFSEKLTNTRVESATTHCEMLLDYRRRVSALYARVRESTLNTADTCIRFRRERDELFRTHPQSALSARQKANFSGLDYYEYDPTWRFVVPLDHAVEPLVLHLNLPNDGLIRLQQFGRVCFTVGEYSQALMLFWVMGYGVCTCRKLHPTMLRNERLG